MAYDKTNDFKQIQADVLTIDTTNNENISSLKQLKTSNKSITKAINALNEQLGNAQTSASDAVQRVVSLEAEIARLQALLNGEPQQPAQAEHIMGRVLIKMQDDSYQWWRINQDIDEIEFDPNHGTWANMRSVTTDLGEFVEIPVTYVKTEKLQAFEPDEAICYWIADGPADGFHVHPAFLGPDGKPHNLQISAYVASKNANNQPVSIDKGEYAANYWEQLSYNDVHNMTLPDGYYPYSIYDHHFIARMALIEFYSQEELSSPNRVNYHGIHDLFGCKNGILWLDGFTSLNGYYQVMAGDGSRTMCQTLHASRNSGGPIVSCELNDDEIDKDSKVDFGDLFIANQFGAQGNFGEQSLGSDMAFFVDSKCVFNLNCRELTYSTYGNNFRLTHLA